MEITPEVVGYGVVGFVVVVLAIVVVKKFGRLIMTALTVIGAVTVAVVVYVVYRALTGTGLGWVRVLWGMVR